MGSGPGEMWVGPEEIKDAYEHFFQGYDKGQQEFEYKFKHANTHARRAALRFFKTAHG